MPKNKSSANGDFSSCISDVIRIIATAQKDYQYNYEEVGRLDGLTQDYLHKLELDELDYRSRAKVATQLASCRKERRIHKDTAEMLKPIAELVDSDKGKCFLNLLREALGKTRKIEDYIKNRTYIPRVSKQNNS